MISGIILWLSNYTFQTNSLRNALIIKKKKNQFKGTQIPGFELLIAYSATHTEHFDESTGFACLQFWGVLTIIDPPPDEVSCCWLGLLLAATKIEGRQEPFVRTKIGLHAMQLPSSWLYVWQKAMLW